MDEWMHSVIDSLCGQSGGWMDGKCKFEIVRMDG